jgi:hypothetical protein
MDKTQLITIAISALFGAVAKSLVDWLASIIKTTHTVSAVTAKIKIIFSKSNRAVMFDMLSLLIYVGVLVNFYLSEGSPTRLEILLIVGASLAVIFMLLVLFWDISKAVNERKIKP